MMIPKQVFIALSICFLAFTSCERTDLGPAPMPDDYREQFEEWHNERLESLTNPTGWMRLAGLYWLEDGVNRFGSSDSADLQFPEGSIAGIAGTFTLLNGRVSMQVESGVNVTRDGNQVTELVLFDGEESHAVESGSLHWLAIQRGDLTGIRLYNKNNPEVDAFNGFDRFDINPEWHLKASFIPKPEGSTIPILNILGQLEETPSPGSVEFMKDGEIFTLEALEGSTRLFLIVGDLTNKTETYQAGRYLYIDWPEQGSEYTVIDFNKLYNPPCSYNLYSTCQLPPVENRLDIAIEAGEKRPVGWSGR